MMFPAFLENRTLNEDLGYAKVNVNPCTLLGLPNSVAGTCNINEQLQQHATV